MLVYQLLVGLSFVMLWETKIENRAIQRADILSKHLPFAIGTHRRLRSTISFLSRNSKRNSGFGDRTMGRETKRNRGITTNGKHPRRDEQSTAMNKHRKKRPASYPPDRTTEEEHEEDATSTDTTNGFSFNQNDPLPPPPPLTDLGALQTTTTTHSAAAIVRRHEIMELARHEIWSEEATVLLRVLEQYAEYCEPETADGESCRQALFEAGVHAALVRRLGTHFAHDGAVQAKGLEVLFHLSSSPFEIIENALLYMGAVQVAVQAMWRFPNDSEIQVFACVLVGNLTNSLPNWNSILQQATEAKKSLENSSTETQKSSIDHAEESGSVQETEEKDVKESPDAAASYLLVAVQDAQQRHYDNEKIQEAVVFLLERCLSVAGSLMLEQLIASAPHCVNGLLLAKQKYPHNPGISGRVKSFFQKLVSISDTSNQ